MNLNSWTDQELVSKLKIAIGEERKLLTEILNYLHEVDSRLLFAELGYSSLYEFCTRHLGYSDGSAYRRIQSMRLLKSLPPLEQTKTESKIKSGEVTITNLSLLQGFFKTEKKQGKTYSIKEKTHLISSIENRSKREVEKELVALQPLTGGKEKVRAVSAELTEVKFTANSGLMKKLARAREVLAHSDPHPTYADLFERLADEFLNRKDPLVKSMRATTKTRAEKTPVSIPTKATNFSPPAEKPGGQGPHRFPRYIPASVRHAVMIRDQGCCTYEAPHTGKKCDSRFGLELDHIEPHAKGGANSVENLRLRCRAHNTLHARESFRI